MHSSNSNARPRMGGEQLTIMFEHCTDQRYYRGDSGSGSGRSSPSTSLPCTPVDLFPHSPLDVALAAEDSWNLIPYDVPWGPEYYHYRAGTLPGPEGACIFLRSPTPLKNRRTQKACNKCRQRKAKCSGSRPACSRCIARGYVCEYVEEEKRTAPQNAARARRQRAHSECSSEPAETADSLSDCDSSDYVQPKEEPGLSTPELSFAEHDIHAHSHSPVGYHPHHHDAHYGSLAAAYEYDGAVGDAYAGHEQAAALGEYYEHAGYADGPAAYFASAPVGVGAGSAAQMYHEATDPHGAAASVHAPRPVRCTGSPAFLTPEEHHQLGAFAAAADAHTHVHIHAHGHHAHARGLQHHNDPMLISLAAADEAAPQMALPQVPLMPSPTDPALDAGAVEYAQQQQQQQQQEMYYYPGAGEPAMQFPYLQYQYAVQTYSPTAAGGQDELAAGLYAMPMPMLPVGMMA